MTTSTVEGAGLQKTEVRIKPKVSKNTVNAITGIILLVVGFALGNYVATERSKERVDSAVKSYAHELDQLIVLAADEDRANFEAEVRAVVSTRNDLRWRLITLATLFDAEIDELETLVLHMDLGQAPSTDQMYQMVKGLELKWPSKRKLIEYEVRKMIAEFGLDQSRY